MSNLRQLKQKFDRVLIKYTDKSCEVLIVDGLSVYSGSSKCHENDNFDKKLGRMIALGRAEFAYKVKNENKSSRETNFSIGGEKYGSITHGDVISLDKNIVDFLPSNRQTAN